MNLQAHYNAMRRAAGQELARGAAEIDKLIDSPADSRRGITLLARPPARLTAAIGKILADFRQIEPDQYFYPASDLHVTVLSIISCYPGFTLDLIAPAAYQQALRAICQVSRPFTITYRGLTASAGGVMVQGFPADGGLEELRQATRRYFQASGLAQSIDQRYCLQTAHSTVIRFRQPLHNPAQLLAMLARYEDHCFGSFEVDTVELVYNDWYQRGRNTVLLEKSALGKGIV